MRRAPETEKNGATGEVCTKREEVEVRKPIWQSTYCVPGPKPNTLLLLYECDSHSLPRWQMLDYRKETGLESFNNCLKVM